MRRVLDTPASIWWQTFAAGLRILPRERKMGLKRVILPVSYWRTQEFAYTARQLLLGRGARILDVGSPKDLPALLASCRGYEVVATDILPGAIELSNRYARALGVEGVGAGRMISEVQDGRKLPYPDASFDAAFAVSVIEHIPDSGDSAAVAELVRVVRPGGRIVITTPYGLEYRETFVQRDVYERARAGNQSVFYERHYDDAALQQRVLSVAGAILIDLRLIGESGVQVERFITKSRLRRTLLSPFEAPLAIMNLR